MPLTKVKVNNLHTEVSTMIQNIAVDNSVDSAAVTSIVNTNIAAKSTSDVSEGSNLYYTDARVDARAQLKIDALVGSAPGTLDTLQELGDALGDDPNFATTVTNSIATKLPLAGGTLTGNLSFGNNDKAIFGAGSDLQIYHDGSNSYITESNATGSLFIKGTHIYLQNSSGQDALNLINGNAFIKSGGATKLATTSTGIDVTGTVTSDGLTVDGNTYVAAGNYFTQNTSGYFFSGASNYDAGIFATGTSLTTIRTQNNLSVVTNNTERMRIDASGNLLVGKTTGAFATAGIKIQSDGQTEITTLNGGSLYLNRLSSDGLIAGFYKDSSAVGSIAANGGSIIVGSGNTGLYFDNGSDRLIPVDPATASGRDNAVDLGGGSERFKDLYLSGGVYLGGTGSANKLDDYEEGQHTLTINQGGISIHSHYADAVYTKVGRLVTIQGLLLATSSGDTNILKINLPFVSKSRTATQTDYYIGSAMPYNVPTGTGGLVPYIVQNQDKMAFLMTVNNGTWTTLNGTDINNGDHIYFSISYMTN